MAFTVGACGGGDWVLMPGHGSSVSGRSCFMQGRDLQFTLPTCCSFIQSADFRIGARAHTVHTSRSQTRYMGQHSHCETHLRHYSLAHRGSSLDPSQVVPLVLTLVVLAAHMASNRVVYLRAVMLCSRCKKRPQKKFHALPSARFADAYHGI